MELRAYKTEDCAALARLFYDTVHSVNANDYSRAQCGVWATGQVDLAAWDASFRAHYTLIAVKGGEIVGFGDIDATGYLDRLYVHKDHQREGIASALCCALEAHFPVNIFTTHASVTAKPFFERRGYQTVKMQQVERGGVQLTNYVMEKRRCPPL